MPLRTFSDAQHAIVTSSAGGALATVAAVAAKRVGIYRMILVVGGATVITIQDTGATALSAPFSLAANGSIVIDTPINGDPWWVSGLGLGIQINSSNAVAVAADVYYLQGP